MLNCIFESITGVTLLASASAANTAAATSAYVDVRGFEGQIAVIVDTGILVDGTVTYTFDTATDASATGTAAVVPVNGALTVVTTSNDPLVQIATFDCTQLKGFLRIVGTKSAAGAFQLGVTVVGLKKYAS
jgi:hypothetical protein